MDSLRRRANARNVSFRISLRWPIHIINPVDETKLSFKATLFYSLSSGNALHIFGARYHQDLRPCFVELTLGIVRTFILIS